LIFILSSNCSIAQNVSVYIANQYNNAPIAYAHAWSEISSYGVTSDSLGVFRALDRFASDTFKITAIGYIPQLLTLSDVDTLLMIPDTLSLNPVIVLASTDQLQFENLGRIGKSGMRNTASSGPRAWRIAQKFVSPRKAGEMIHLKALSFRTSSAVDSAMFEIQIMSVDSVGSPSHPVNDKPIYGYASQGKALTTVDLNGITLDKPEFYIAFCWLAIPKNQYDHPCSEDACTSFAPEIGLVNSKKSENCFAALKAGRWFNLSSTTLGGNKSTSCSSIGFELEVSYSPHSGLD